MTPSGGIFYTGTTGCNQGGGSGGGGFFRYIAGGGDNNLIQIANNWYNFIYDVVSTATTDKAVFFGPDPTSASAASWNSACVFLFDPNGGSTTAARTNSVITCGGDIWSWVNMSRSSDIDTYGKGYQDNGTATAAYKTEFTNRCTADTQVFAGGGSQISAIKQDSTGQIYVIGNVRKKNAGTVSCNVEVRGAHCKTSSGPTLTYTTSATCTSAGGTWVDEGTCSGSASTSTACFGLGGQTWYKKSAFYSSVTTNICTQSGEISSSNWWSNDNSVSHTSATSSSENTAVFRVQNLNCTPPATNGTGGDSWTTEYKALAKVNSTTKTLMLLSDAQEQATGLWVINNVAYYSAFNATSGQYLLRRYDGTSVATMVSNLEVYNLSDSGDSARLYFDGLDFSTNSYKFGTVDTATYAITAKTGLTGVVKTIVILPK